MGHRLLSAGLSQLAGFNTTNNSLVRYHNVVGFVSYTGNKSFWQSNNLFTNSTAHFSSLRLSDNIGPDGIVNSPCFVIRNLSSDLNEKRYLWKVYANQFRFYNSYDDDTLGHQVFGFRREGIFCREYWIGNPGSNTDRPIISLNGPVRFRGTQENHDDDQQIDKVYDQDDFAANSNRGLATQQSIKAYVDNQISGIGGVAQTGYNEVMIGGAVNLISTGSGNATISRVTLTQDWRDYDELFFVLDPEAESQAVSSRISTDQLASRPVVDPNIIGNNAFVNSSGLSVVFGRTDSRGAGGLVIFRTANDRDLLIGTAQAQSFAGGYNLVSVWGVTIASNVDSTGLVSYQEEQTLTDEQRETARGNIGAAALSTSQANDVQPGTQGFTTLRTINESVSGLPFTVQSTGAIGSANGPIELFTTEPLDVVSENSFLSLEIQVVGDGSGSGTLFLGRQQGSARHMDIDGNNVDHPFGSIDPGVAQTFNIRLHTSQAEQLSNGSYRWRIIIGSNQTGAITTGTINFVGTISQESGESLSPNAWRIHFDNGPNGYLIPHANGFLTPGDIVSLDTPINRHDVTTVWMDISPRHSGNYGLTIPRALVEVPVDLIHAMSVTVSGSNAQQVDYDPRRVMSINARSDGYGDVCFAGGNTKLDGTVGIQWVRGDPTGAPDDITHFAVVVGPVVAPFSQGAIYQIRAA